MPADDEHDGTVAGRPTAGPRHAAPRRPLFNRLHMPAGKAIALAAMPTAVLMGMGLTPQFAQASPSPKSPYRDGPCVPAADKDADDRAGSDHAKDARGEGDKDRGDENGDPAEGDRDKADAAGNDASSGDTDVTRHGTVHGGATSAPSASESAAHDSGAGDTDRHSGSADAADADEQPAEPSTTPSETESYNPLDPLGWGKAISDFFTGKKDEDAEEGAEEPAEDGKEADRSPSTTASPSADETGARRASSDSEDQKKREDPGKDDTASQRESNGQRTPSESPSATATSEDGDEAPGDQPSGSASQSSDAGTQKDADGKKRYPCVVEKKVAGSDEQPPAAVPNDPWYLQASSLTLNGLKYHGVVNLTTPNGKTKQALKFTTDTIDIGDLHQLVDGPAGKTIHVQAGEGTTSTFRDGTVTMYTERLEGNLFGLIPVTFDPEHPPPLTPPFLFFTKVKITQAGQFGGTLTLPGLHQHITD